MKKFILIILLLLLAHNNCLPRIHKSNVREAAIPVINERLYLAPIINETGFEKIDSWPQTEQEQRILLKNFVTIWKRLKVEFRRCEKFGNYTVVEDYQNPDIRVSITLSQYDISNDSLFIPVKMQVERITDDKYFIYTIPASTYKPTDDISKSDPYHFSGKLLSNYCRNFPYRQIVSFFYAH